MVLAPPALKLTNCFHVCRGVVLLLPYGHQFNDFQVKGIKKLENFFRRQEELFLWKNSATPEEIEYMEIQSELEKELFLSHLK